MRRLILVFLILYVLISSYLMVVDENRRFVRTFAVETSETAACQITQPFPAVPNLCRIQIGIINSFTDRGGACFSGGTEHKRGYELALAEIQEINGCQVALVQIDDMRSSSLARTAVTTLADTDALLVLGAYSSGATLEAADEADRVGIPLLVPSASSELITSIGYEWVFRINATSADYVSQALALTATLNDAPSVGILYENTVFGESAAVAITSQAEDLGVSIVAYEAFQPGVLADATVLQSDKFAFRSARIRDAKPDVIFMVSNSVDDALNLLKLGRGEGLQPQLFIGVAGAFVSPDFLDEAGDEVENLVVTAQWSADVAWYEDDGDDAGQFIANFEEIYGRAPGMRSVQTYTTLFVAKAAIELAAKMPDCPLDEPEIFRACVRDALRTITLGQTLFGPIDFDNSSGQNVHQVLLLQAVKTNDHYRFVTVYPEQYQLQPVKLETPIAHDN